MMRRSIACWSALLSVGLLCSLGASAQVLARPGRITIAPEAWWRAGVFYRIAPEHFQDSDDDGAGDLRGIAQRLDYLAALGVDAIVLDLPFDDTGFDDLLADATRRHIRLVIGLDRHQGATGSDPAGQRMLQAEAHQWLLRGAGGLVLPPSAMSGSPADEDALVAALRAEVASYPGERVLITESPGSAAGQLFIVPVKPEAAALPEALQITPPTGAVPLLELESTISPAHWLESPGVDAAVLLTQHAAVLLDYGQELGEPAPDRMPWTPGNVTAPPASSEPAHQPPAEIVYGPYRPYVPPPPKPKPMPASPNAVVLPDPDSLPGFSTKPPPSRATESTEVVRSVVLQERDPRSLLNLYRKLIALHHGNASLRDGAMTPLTQSGGMAVWMRTAPAGARTAAPVIVGANATKHPFSFSLLSFTHSHLRSGPLRSLLPGGLPGPSKSTSHFSLAPGEVFVGEVVPGR